MKLRIIFYMTAISLLLSWAGSFYARHYVNPHAAVRDAYVKGDFVGTLARVRPLAESGDVAAIKILAHMYMTGKGTPQNYKEAAKWYVRCARANDTVCQSNAALLYYKGSGMPQNYIEAMSWLLVLEKKYFVDGHDLSKIRHTIKSLRRKMKPQDFKNAQEASLVFLKEFPPVVNVVRKSTVAVSGVQRGVGGPS